MYHLNFVHFPARKLLEAKGLDAHARLRSTMFVVGVRSEFLDHV
jgi:hypothetical protein